MQKPQPRVLTAALLAGALFAAAGPSPARACGMLITWQADLAAPAEAPTPAAPSSAPPPVRGTATVAFDFVHPGATFQVDAKTLPDTQQIALHITRSYSDKTGPVLFTLYSTADGPLPALYRKHVGPADLHPQPDLKIVTLADAVNAVLDGRAYVTVTPKDHPERALSGFIHMRKTEIYSDAAGDAAHDPALHQSASAHPPATSTVNGTVSH